MRLLPKTLFNYLSSVSLADLVREQHQRNELHEQSQKLHQRKTVLHSAVV